MHLRLRAGDLCTMEGMAQKHLQHRVPREDQAPRQAETTATSSPGEGSPHQPHLALDREARRRLPCALARKKELWPPRLDRGSSARWRG